MKKLLATALLTTSLALQAASSYTPHYHLGLPADGDSNWGSSYRTSLGVLDTQLYLTQNGLNSHVNGVTGAHLATAISTVPGTICASINVQLYLACIDAQINAVVGGGAVSITTDQTITGQKTFSNPIIATGGLVGAVNGAVTAPTLSVGSLTGFLRASSGTVAAQAAINAASDITGTLPVANGGSGLTALGSANQILGVNSGGTASEYKTLSGTTNQVSVANSTGSVTLSLPQSIAASSSPSFANATLSSLGTGVVHNTNGSPLTSSAVALASDVSGTLPLANGGTAATSISSGIVRSSGTALSGAGTVALGSEVTGVLAPTLGGTGLNALGSAGYFLGVNIGGTAMEYKSITGTTNRVNVTASAGNIQLTLPQDINTTSSPSFTGLTVSGVATGYVKSTSGVLSSVTSIPASALSGTGNLTGTANQVTVTGGTGAVIGTGTTLALPQDINTTSSPTFVNPTFSTALLKNGSFNITLTPPTLAASYTLTFPTGAGSSNQVLSTDGTGVTSWIDASSGFTQQSNVALTAGGSIVIGTTNAARLQHWRVAGSGAAVTLSTAPFGTTAPQDRTLVCLAGTDDTNTVTVPFSDTAKGAVGNGDTLLGKYDSACFRYLATEDRYIIESRSP